MNYLIIFLVLLFLTSLILYYKNSKFKNYINKYIKKRKYKTFEEKGAELEQYLFNSLRNNIKGDLCLLRNIYIPYNLDENNSNEANLKATEIDLLLLHRSGIYMIESKNYTGSVFGKNNEEYWTIVYKNKKKVKVLNPIIQNLYHVKAFKNFLKEKFGVENVYINSIIVMGNACNIDNFKNIKDQNYKLVKQSDFYKIIYGINNSKKELLSSKDIEILYQELINLQNPEYKSYNINRISEKYKKAS